MFQKARTDDHHPENSAKFYCAVTREMQSPMREVGEEPQILTRILSCLATLCSTLRVEVKIKNKL